MKGRSKRLLALLLAAGMLATQIPASPLLVQAETSSDVDAGSEETGLTDDTVVATTDWNYADENPDYCAHFYESDRLYQYVLASLGLPSDTTELTYGQVKDVTVFEIPERTEDEEWYYYVYLDGIDKILPNLEKLVANQSISDFNYIGTKVKDITINTPDASFMVTDLNDKISQIESLTVNASSIEVNGHWDSESDSYVYDTINSANLKKLALNGSTYSQVLDWISEQDQLEELHITNASLNQDYADKIFTLKNLTVLDLSNNEYLQSIPDSVKEFTNLTSLNLSGCGLSDIPDLSKLDSLASLNLMDNENLIRKVVMKKVPEKFASDENWVKENFEAQNEVVTTGDEVSDYYIPDQTLYAELKEKADRNDDGILTVAEAWGTTSLYLWNDEMSDVKDFTGFGTVFKNLTSLDFRKTFDDEDQEAVLVNEIAKMKDMGYLEMNSVSQSAFDTICENLQNLSSINFYASQEEGLDITKISKLSQLTSAYLNCDLKGYTALNDLEELHSLSIQGNKVKLSDIQTALDRLSSLSLSYSGTVNEQDSVVFENLTNLTSLTINTSSYLDGTYVINTLDLQKLENLYSLNVSGSVEQVILPKSAENMNSLYLNEYSGNQTRGTIENLASLKNLNSLQIYGFETKDLKEIAQLTKLGWLRLNGCGLESTEGIGKLTELYYLDMENNEFETIDEGIGNLTNLSTLDLENNDKLTGIDPAITNLTGLYNVYICSNNELTAIPDFLGNNAELSTISIHNNWKLADIGTSISKLTKVRSLNLSYNALETLPDLGALCNEEGLLYHSDYNNSDDTSVYANRLQLYGNKLSKDVILAAGLSEEFTKDENWMIRSTARRYGNKDYLELYYPDLTEAFILRELEQHSSNSFVTDKDMTFSDETLQYIQDNERFCYITLISGEDAKIQTEYNINGHNIAESWDGTSSVTLKAPKEDSVNVADYAKYFSDVTPLLGYTKPDIPDFVGASTQISGLDQGDYWIYRYDPSTGNMSMWSTITITENSQWVYFGSDNSDNVYLVTPAGTYNNHNVSGASSGMEAADITGRTVLMEQKQLDENSYTYEVSEAFKQLVADAEEGDTLKVYADGMGAYWDMDLAETLQNKHLKLDVLFTSRYYYYIDSSTDMVRGLRLVDCSDSLVSEVYSTSIYLNDNEYEYAPMKLFNGTKYFTVSSQNGKTYEKVYAGNQFVNGTKVYLYSIDYVNRTVTLADTVEVKYGYLEFNNLDQYDQLYATTSELSRTTWTEDEEYHYVDPDEPDEPDQPSEPDEPIATPDEPDQPSEPDTPVTPDKPGDDNADKPSNDANKPSGGNTNKPSNDANKPGTDTSSEPVIPPVPSIEPVVYKVTENATNMKSGALSDLVLTVNATNNKFKGVMIDGEAVAASHKASKANTIVTIKADALKSAIGVHNVVITFKDGTAAYSYTVLEADKKKDTTPDGIDLPDITLTEHTTEKGKQSAPATVKSADIVTKDEAVDILKEKMAANSKLPTVEVITQGSVPEVGTDLFEEAKKNNKNISFGATDENNNLMYSWTFDYQSLDTSKMNGKTMDLSISFASDKKKEIEELTGQKNGLYISINGYHGELPGPATVKTYVGNQYKNGDKVYLYYYNEETKKVELIGGKALTVSGGYVEYTLTHCSTYFLSETTPDQYGIKEETKVPVQPGTPSAPADKTPALPEAPASAAPAGKTPANTAAKNDKKNIKGADTGDNSMPLIPVAVAAAGFALLGFASKRKKKNI